ncbi:MAG: ABC transporter ATP-binding protein [Pseudomonadota bacterium]
MLSAIYSRFEAIIDPFADPEGRDAEQRPPSDSVFGFIAYFARQAPWVFVFITVLGLLFGATEILMFRALGGMVDLLNVTTPERILADWGATIIALAVLLLLGRFLLQSTVTLMEEQVVIPHFFQLVRWQNHKHVSRQSVGFFQDDFAGRITSKVMQSGQATGDFLISLLQVILLFVTYLFGSVLLLAQMDLKLLATLSVWAVAYFFLIRYFVPRVRVAARGFSEAIAQVNGFMVDAYSHAALMKVDSNSAREDQFMRNGVGAYVQRIREFTRLITGMRVTLSILNAVLSIAVIAQVVLLWRSEVLSTGAVAFALPLIFRLTLLSGRMLGQFNSLFRNYGTIQNAMETVSEPLRMVDAPSAPDLVVSDCRIQFDDVSFHYGKDGGVIDGLSFVVEPGQSIGIAGPSGAGKTTIASLLLRLHDVAGGRIVIDGQDISQVTQASLRGQIGLVTQDTALLNRSVMENIAFAKPDATEDEIRGAAARANALEFIEGLEDAKGRKGFDAHVGERGVKLSGGQRQRIAIARVFLKDAPILVLDEATSALDSQAEAEIQRHLDDLMAGKTVIAVAHRLSTIAAMDKILVMRDGAIVEQGGHDELVAADDLYADLWRRQSGGVASLVSEH